MEKKWGKYGENGRKCGENLGEKGEKMAKKKGENWGENEGKMGKSWEMKGKWEKFGIN